MRILFAGGGTGGHLYPGLAIARALQRLRPEIKPYFIGAKRGIDKDVLPGAGFPFLLVDAHPWYRRDWWNNWRTVVGHLKARHEMKKLFKESRPLVIVGTGGYAAIPAMAHGFRHGVPLVEWTGDAMPSLTARGFSRFCREVYLSFPESASHLWVRSPDALVDTGAPVEPPPAVRMSRSDALRLWRFPDDAQVVLVYGGSQGSSAINAAIKSWVRGGLPPRVHLIWGTGRRTIADYASLESDRVRVRPYLSPISDAYAAADFAITRAGTMTTAELMAWHIPAILVPLPTAAADHQTLNAKALQEAGAAIHVPQQTLSAHQLTDMVGAALGDPARMAAMRAAAARRARPDAANVIAKRILALIDR